MQSNFHPKQSFQNSLNHSIGFMLDSQNLKNTTSFHFNQQFNSKSYNPLTKISNKPPPINNHPQSMNKPLNSVKQTTFIPTQNQYSRNLPGSKSPHSQPPLSPKQQSHTKNTLHLEFNTVTQSSKDKNQDMKLQINSAKNSKQNYDKIIPKNEGFTPIQQNTQLDGQGFQFSLLLNQKMITLQNKSNRLIQKVLAIQQQIQKYAEVQQKQLRPIGHQSPFSPLLQTKSLLNKRDSTQELDSVQVQHQQSIRKMNILGRNKVKIIQNLEIQIQNFQQKVMDSQQKKTQDIKEEKKQIDNNFINYYKHKNDILKQSKSQKFSFKHLKYLTQQKKYDKSDCGDQIIETIEGKQNEQNLQTQLKKLKEQFSSYQQRTSKQLENYKERLNQNILEKQILKKELQRQKYEHLKEKLFNKNKPMKTSKMISPQKTARDFVQAKFGQTTSRQFTSTTNFAFDLKLGQYKPLDQVGQNITQLMNLPKTDRVENNQEPQFEDLQQFKDEVSMRYIEENQQIQGLQDQIRDMDQIIEDLRNRLQKGNQNFIAENDQLKNLLEEKERTLAELSDVNQGNTKEIQDLKNEINDMNNYIFQCKEENELQNQEIQEYKNVIEQFVEEVKNLRNQLGKKNHLTEHLHQHIEEAEKINRLCENQINQLQKENESLKKEIQRLENQVKLKEAKQRYNQALLQKQKSKETADNSLISQHNAKIQGQIQSSKISNQTIKELKQQNQQKLDLQRIEFDKILKYKELKIQQLQQNFDQLKNQISHKVEQQVNEGIRTFLRYRKHTNHLSHEIFKVVVYGKKIYNGDEFKNVQFDISFKGIKVQNPKNTRVIACRTDRSEGSNLSLRKLIDAQFNQRKSLNNMNELRFKLQISLKLIQLAIELMHQQGNSQETSSRSTKSSKKLPSLNPESIYAIESSQSGQQKSQSQKNNSQLSTQQKVQKLEKDAKSYQLIYLMGNKKQSESKKDKNLVYLSPQVLLSMNESQHSYCWSLGIIIDEILNNRPYYTKIDEIVTRKDNYKYQGISSNLDENLASNLKEILEKMVKKNFKERPSLNVIYESFSKIMTQIRNNQQINSI